MTINFYHSASNNTTEAENVIVFYLVFSASLYLRNVIVNKNYLVFSVSLFMKCHIVKKNLLSVLVKMS